MLTETEITLATAAYVREFGWEVRSLALPRGGAGIVLKSSAQPSSSLRDSIVPDIVAARSGSRELLIVESKPAFSEADATKLALLGSELYEESVKRQLGCSSNDLICCLAFGADSTTFVSGPNGMMGASVDAALTFATHEGVLRTTVAWDRRSAFHNTSTSGSI